MGTRVRKITHNRWYALAAFAVASTSGFLWYAFPSVSWWPIFPVMIVGLLPIIGEGRIQFKLRPVLLLALFVFTATSVVGIWTAYNPAAAVDKFRVLLGALFLFLAVVYQPRRNIWLVLSILGFIGSVFAIYFSLTYDWRVSPVDTAVVNRIGSSWMDIRYTLNLPTVVDDIAGGILGILIPLQLALFMHGLQTKRWGVVIYSSITTMLISAGFFLTGLRAAWGAFAAALCLSILLILAQRVLSHYSSRVFRNVAAGFMLLMVAGGFLFIGILSGEILPGVQQTALYWAVRSRFSLFRDVFDLTGDFFLFGGGLTAFPGLYSRYILSIFDYYLAYSHNLYLDLIIEQGIFGLIAFMTILLASLWVAVMHRFSALREFNSLDLQITGILVGLWMMTLQGLIENSLYGMRGTPFLLLLPGLAFAAARHKTRMTLEEMIPVHKKLYRIGTGTAFALAIVLIMIFYRPIAAHWHANVGSIALAKIELKGWPETRLDSWSYGDEMLKVSLHHFNKTLKYDANNRAANYRLGRIALERRDFATAILHLERAFHQDQHYHGIRKNLGYSYVFDGQIEAGRKTLAGIPEASSDMEVYNWWWGTQGRDDLASYADQYIRSNSQ
jgi:hypothetical protein